MLVLHHLTMPQQLLTGAQEASPVAIQQIKGKVQFVVTAASPVQRVARPETEVMEMTASGRSGAEAIPSIAQISRSDQQGILQTSLAFPLDHLAHLHTATAPSMVRATHSRRLGLSRAWLTARLSMLTKTTTAKMLGFGDSIATGEIAEAGDAGVAASHQSLR